jgi:GT2 family glycosyltransferase
MNSAVAIINWNSGHRLRACIESVMAAAADAPIVIVDNASQDGSLRDVEAFEGKLHFVRNHVNRGFAAAVNQAFAATSTAYVLVLNPDIRVLPGTAQALEAFMDTHARAGAIGGYVGDKYLPKELPTVTALVRENLAFAASKKVFNESTPVKVGQPAAAALLIRRAAYDEIGGFDEQFYPAWYEDVDFCQRLSARRWDLYFAPHTEFLHEGGYSADVMGASNFTRSYYGNQIRYARKHFGSSGSAIVRASIAVGMIGRMIGRPSCMSAYGKVLIEALKGS